MSNYINDQIDDVTVASKCIIVTVVGQQYFVFKNEMDNVYEYLDYADESEAYDEYHGMHKDMILSVAAQAV